MNDCLFCKFVTNHDDIQKVYENEHVIAFLDANPVNPGHTLLVPKNHSRNMLEISEEDACHFATVLPMLSRAVKEGMKADGVNIGINNESAAHQKIFHTHIHIIPRHDTDGLEMWHGKKYQEGENAEILKKITDAMKDK